VTYPGSPRLLRVPAYPWLTTWILWSRLRYPPVHPLFARVQRTTFAPRTGTFIRGIVLPGVFLSGGICTLIGPVELPLPVLLPAAMVVLSSAYVVGWAVAITMTIAGEQERGTYDEMCVTPSGAEGINLAICAACLHHDDALGCIDLLRRWITGMFLFVLVTVLLMTGVQAEASGAGEFLIALVTVVLVSAVLYAEHVQSIVMGCLAAMLLPASNRNTIEMRAASVMGFLLLQFGTLLLSLPAGLIFSNGNEVSLIWLSLVVFYVSRECLIVTLWRLLAYRLNFNAAEFDF
jgi:hypothetical protein